MSVVVEVTRGSVVESRHRAVLVLCDPRGRKIVELDDARLLTFFRSSATPMQALPPVADGAAAHFGMGTRVAFDI